jgi:hypothetical protein
MPKRKTKSGVVAQFLIYKRQFLAACVEGEHEQCSWGFDLGGSTAYCGCFCHSVDDVIQACTEKVPEAQRNKVHEAASGG